MNDKKKKQLLIAAVAVIVVIVIALFAWNGSKSGGSLSDAVSAANGQTNASDSTTGGGGEVGGDNALYDNDGLKITSLFQYTGGNPDCNDEMGEDIAALSIQNTSDQHLKCATITAKMEDGSKLEFEVTDIPAGQTALVFASDNSKYDPSNPCKKFSAKTDFDDQTELMSDSLTIQSEETTVTLTNISDQDLTNLTVSCHTLFDGDYFGGLTYSYPVESIPAGQSVTIQADACYLGEAAVVRVSRDS